MTKGVNDPTARFFDELASRAYEPLLRNASGAMRFDVVDGRRTRRWLVRVEKGNVEVTSGGGDAATCVVRADRVLFDRLVSGRANAVAAVLRGELRVEGDWRLLVRVQRLFPGPRRRRAAA